MPLVPAKCTQCGAILQVDQSKDAAICQHCSAAFVVEKAINNYTVHNHINADTVNVYEQKDFVIRAGVLERYQGEATDVVVPDNVIAIGKEAFKDCQGLRSVQLPEGLETIYGGAFEGCTHLRSINLPEGLETIYGRAFLNCIHLRSIILPDSLTVIGCQAFHYCRELHNVKLPAKLTMLGDYAFSDTALTEITIPPLIRGIGKSAFCNTALKKVTFLSNPSLGEDAFYACPLETIVGRDTFAQEDEYVFTKCTRILPMIYRQQNRCQSCGGIFKGHIFKKCYACGKRKDY